jgi:pilus assembly protein CpaF
LSLSDRIQSRNPDPVAPVTREQHAEPEPVRAPTDPFADLKSRVHHDVITRLGPRLFASGGDEGRDASIEPRVLEAVEEAIALDKTPLTRQERAQVTREIADDILGYGPLEPFLRDDTVSEIMVNGPHSIWVERRGKLLRTDAGFVDDQHLLRIIDKIISRIGRRIDEASPMVDARLPDGSRVNAIIPPLAVTGPTLTIRKFRRDPLTMEDLLRFGTLTPRAAQLLEACVRGKLNILISGGTGSGKTTTLNVLSAAIPEGERIITIEDAAELQLRQEHVITLESRPANIEGKGLINIRDLVRNCLRMRPDRIIVGECRGAETIDMLQAMNTGHDGSLTTIHANTPRDALSRVETLVLTGGVELPLKAIREQIASAFDMVVQVSRLVDGTRRITHVTEVLRMESDVVTLQDLFVAKPLEDGEEVAAGSVNRLLGSMRATGIKPQFLSKLGENGVHLPPQFFQLEPERAGNAPPTRPTAFGRASA